MQLILRRKYLKLQRGAFLPARYKQTMLPLVLELLRDLESLILIVGCIHRWERLQ